MFLAELLVLKHTVHRETPTWGTKLKMLQKELVQSTPLSFEMVRVQVVKVIEKLSNLS